MRLHQGKLRLTAVEDYGVIRTERKTQNKFTKLQDSQRSYREEVAVREGVTAVAPIVRHAVGCKQACTDRE